MMKRGMLATLALIAVTAAAIGGCVVHAHPGHVHAMYGPPVVIETAHVHTDACGHFYYGGRWYYSSGHRHVVGCGHVWRGGMWVVVD